MTKVDFKAKSMVLITCGEGLVDWLADEVKNLGFEVKNSHKTGLETDASLADCIKLNMNLYTAVNVLYLLDNFTCGSPDVLYERASRIAWETIIPQDEYVSVVSRVDTPTIDNTMFASLKLKDAIVDRMNAKTGTRPDSGPNRDNIVINLFWKDDRCWIYLNTSGNKLSDRNYRKMPHTAPMQESLAAGVIRATGYDGSVPFISPMCGSGTLAIEAAMVALNRAPGLLRINYAFQHLLGFDREKWDSYRKSVQKKSAKQLAAPIIATDIDPAAINATRQNCKTAGVDHLIEFDLCDFAETRLPEQPGILIVNPEYGFRIGDVEKLGETYTRLGDFFKQKCQGWTCYIFTGNLNLAKKVGLRTTSRIPFNNGSIECRLLRYDMYLGTRKEKKTEE